MDLEYSEEQRIMMRGVGEWLRGRYGPETLRRLAETDSGYSLDHWRHFAEMGWLGLTIPERYGGIGSDASYMMLIGEQFGAALVREPFLSTTVLGAGLIEMCGTEEQKSEWLPQIAEGRLKFAFAYAEHGSRFSLRDMQVLATRHSGNLQVSGRKIVVHDAPTADRLIVLAQADNLPEFRGGAGLFVIDPSSEGVEMVPYRTLDARRAADVLLDHAPVEAMLGVGQDIGPVVEAVVDRAIAYLAAEALGAMQAALDLTVEHLKTRKQFGRPLSDFQVLRHRAVDMKVQIQAARALTLCATLSLRKPDHERRLAASAAKVQIGRSGRFVGQQAIQLHGGMGITDEGRVGDYLKRLMTIDVMFGNADHHQREFGRISNGQRGAR